MITQKQQRWQIIYIACDKRDLYKEKCLSIPPRAAKFNFTVLKKEANVWNC